MRKKYFCTPWENDGDERHDEGLTCFFPPLSASASRFATEHIAEAHAAQSLLQVPQARGELRGDLPFPVPRHRAFQLLLKLLISDESRQLVPEVDFL